MPTFRELKAAIMPAASQDRAHERSSMNTVKDALAQTTGAAEMGQQRPHAPAANSTGKTVLSAPTSAG